MGGFGGPEGPRFLFLGDISSGIARGRTLLGQFSGGRTLPTVSVIFVHIFYGITVWLIAEFEIGDAHVGATVLTTCGN